MAGSFFAVRALQLIALALLHHAAQKLSIQNGVPPALISNATDISNVSMTSKAGLIRPVAGRWDADCERINDPPIPPFNPQACIYVVDDFCKHIQCLKPEQVVRNKWKWPDVEGCTAGYYLGTNSWKPGKSGCVLMVEEIVEKCVKHSRRYYNVGSNNVEIMPDFSQNGEAIDPEQVMIMLASKKLTL